MNARTADVSRQTAETRIRVQLNLDGTGQCKVHTGIGDRKSTRLNSSH